MIRYALACEKGHDFESWFPSAAGFDRLAATGLVECPTCGSTAVSKAMMAPAVPKKGSPAQLAEGVATKPAEASPAPEPQPVALLSEREQAVRAVLRSMREHVTRTADYVGRRFADEARRMHDGEIEHRSIYGEASPLETKALIEDGIEVHPLPVIPDDRN